MNFRIGATPALCLFLLACPGSNTNPDGGDSGTDGSVPTGSCTEKCADNETCNTTTRSCVSKCGGGGGCDGGVCTKASEGVYSCRPNVTQCNGVICAPGQNTCIGGKCSCTPALRGGRDTCADEGQVCGEQYNPVTQTGGTCRSPALYDECKTSGCPSGACAPCPTGQACHSVFSGGRAVCLHTCTAEATCASDEFCFGKAIFNGGDDRCYPPGLFGFNCEAQNPDGGTENIEVPVANRCKRWTQFPNTTEATNGSTCSYAFFHLNNQLVSTNVCRPPGTVGLYGACKADYARTAGATQCAVGLECVITRGDTGVCLKTCNATDPAPANPTPQPACGASEACVNLYRQEDPTSVLGVCMNTCSVFTSGTNNGCANYVNGATNTPASCVPVPATGRSLVTLDGSGLCIPQKATVATAKQDCAETDPFRGASCASGQLCTAANTVTDSPKCAQPCDLGCVDKADGGALPARCATEANARCSGGATCAKLTSTTGVTLGFCQ